MRRQRSGQERKKLKNVKLDKINSYESEDNFNCTYCFYLQ